MPLVQPDRPTPDQVRKQLVALRNAGYSAEARRRASEWGTPRLIDWPFGVPEPLALFLLGAADLRADDPPALAYLYGPEDFEQAERGVEEDWPT